MDCLQDLADHLSRQTEGSLLVEGTSLLVSTRCACSLKSPAYRLERSYAQVVTRLLVSTKNLLENLTSWSQDRTSDDQISDIYVKLGNDFNAACATFARENISME